MKNRSAAMLAIVAFASIGTSAHAEGDASERCRAAAERGDTRKVVDECTRAIEADPRNERARALLQAAKAKLAQAPGMDDPAKLNPH